MAVPQSVLARLRKIAANRRSGVTDPSTALAQVRVVLRESDPAEVVLYLLTQESAARIALAQAEARLRAANERLRGLSK